MHACVCACMGFCTQRFDVLLCLYIQQLPYSPGNCFQQSIIIKHVCVVVTILKQVDIMWRTIMENISEGFD